MTIERLIRAGRFASLLLLAGLVGCANCRIPAFDPTGERIFAGGTTLAVPAGPTPAFREPATPPRCPGSAIVGAPIGPVSPAFSQTLDPPTPVMLLSPQTMVAPVGSDVVVVAGLCGPKGKYVTRQPIQWMLAPEGVGQIMEVGRERCHLAQLVSSSPEKVNSTYATAHTSTIQQTITRGTTRTEDDMKLKKGESWVSVMSPQEGVSYVTAFAPDEPHWDRRKNVATIYWVDAKWSFPPPAIAKPTDPHRLETHLVRTNNLPIAGWLVRYSILGGTPAALGAAGEQAVQVISDANGFANIDLVPAGAETGITQLAVQILRPDPNPNEQPLLIGQGYTHVQWSAPGLLIRGEATQVTQPDGAINYRIEVVNNGDQLSRDVILSYTPPAGVAVQMSNPQAQSFGDRLEWRLGNIPPRAAQAVTIAARGNSPGERQSCFQARSGDGLQTAPVCFRTQVNVGVPGGGIPGGNIPGGNVGGGAVQLRVRGPNNANVTVGEQIQYGVTVVNNSSAPATGLIARATFAPGLQQIDSAPSPLEREIGTLNPGQSAPEFFLTFIVRQAGTQCTRFDVLGDNNVSQTQQLCIRASERMAQRPSGEVRLRVAAEPREAREGDKIEFKTEATNTGKTALTNVRVILSSNNRLTPTAASEGHEQTERGITWTKARLEPGESMTQQIDCTAAAGGEGVLQAIVVSDQTAEHTEQSMVQVSAAPQPVAPPMLERPPVEPPVRVSGRLKVTANSLANPLRVGGETDIVVRITNEGDGADQNISVRLALQEGLSLKKIVGAPVKPIGIPTKHAIDMEAVKELQAGDQLQFRFQIVAGTPGKQQLTVEVTSASHPTPITREVEIDVFPAGN